MHLGTLAAEVGEAVGTISSELRSRFAAAGEPDLGFVALATLRHLVRHGPRTVTELAQAERVTTQAISLRIRPLVEAGLVTRARDAADARRTVVSVSDRGREAVARASASAQTALEAAIRALGAPERDALETALPLLHRIGAELTGETA